MQNYNSFLPQQGFQTGVGMPNDNPFFISFVNGEAGANAYLVGAGRTGLLFDFNLGKFWIKETDGNGIPKPIRTFSFNEETPKPQVVAQEGGGVTRDEFTKLTQSVSMLSDSVNKLLKDLGGDS